jgi:hypothetical protein
VWTQRRLIFRRKSADTEMMFSVFRLNRVLFPLLAFLAAPLFLSGKDGEDPPPEPFPSLYFTMYYRAWLTQEAARPYWAFSEAETRLQERAARDNLPIFFNDDIVAFYGHPGSPNMGILGRYSKEELLALLDKLAAEYDAVNGKRGVRRAFYLIYGTVQPRGHISYLDEKTLRDWLIFARQNDILVFIDHQIGRYHPVDSLKKLLPYLTWPNVHLALDPEWRTTQPMRHIGSVTAEEINRVQEEMSRYIEEHALSGPRMLVVHQFDWRMIKNRENVVTGYKKVNLVHCADGFGSPALKRSAYAYNALAENMPVKGFKLFLNFGIPGAGYDSPLLSPEEVTTLSPQPALIIYQ